MEKVRELKNHSPVMLTFDFKEAKKIIERMKSDIARTEGEIQKDLQKDAEKIADMILERLLA